MAEKLMVIWEWILKTIKDFIAPLHYWPRTVLVAQVVNVFGFTINYARHDDFAAVLFLALFIFNAAYYGKWSDKS